MIIAGIMDEEPQVFGDIDRTLHKDAKLYQGKGGKKMKRPRISSAER